MTIQIEMIKRRLVHLFTQDQANAQPMLTPDMMASITTDFVDENIRVAQLRTDHFLNHSRTDNEWYCATQNQYGTAVADQLGDLMHNSLQGAIHASRNASNGAIEQFQHQIEHASLDRRINLLNTQKEEIAQSVQVQCEHIIDTVQPTKDSSSWLRRTLQSIQPNIAECAV